MLNDWIHWLSSRTPAELLLALAPLAAVDGLRYALAMAAMCLWDALRSLRSLRTQVRNERTALAADGVTLDTMHSPALRDRGLAPAAHTPSICIVLAGLNEADTVASTMGSVWGAYPDMEIIVVDDGSSDGMAEVARQFAATHDRVLVLRKPNRGGKSSALNFALPFTKAEVIVCVDTDSHVEPGAIERIVQPFRDPAVGAVAGTVIARNASESLLTQLQAAEYLRSIFIGRMLSSRLGILGIVSGAFGAYRREALLRTGGWDVGPGEDGDLVLRLRKGGWRIVHEPYAQCFTNLMTSWRRLFKQRRRWEWAAVTFECRKHVDLANLRSPNFRWSNFAMLAETWILRIGLTYAALVGLAWLVVADPRLLVYMLLTNYVACLGLELIQWLVLMYYTPQPRRDGWSLLCAPLMPLYYFFLKCASATAFTEEFLWRRSYRDTFVPAHVSRTTWHW